MATDAIITTIAIIGIWSVTIATVVTTCDVSGWQGAGSGDPSPCQRIGAGFDQLDLDQIAYGRLIDNMHRLQPG